MTHVTDTDVFSSSVMQADALVAADIFAAIFEVTPERAPDIVRHLAAKGNLPALRTMLASGIMKPGSERGPKLACALTPLVGPGEFEQERAAFVSGALRMLGLDTSQKLGAVLPGVLRISEVRDLLHVFGADPLAEIFTAHPRGLGVYTALGHAALSAELEKSLEMLDVLLEQRREPVACIHSEREVSLFEALIEAEINVPRNDKRSEVCWQILGKLRERTLASTWEYQAGLALLRYLPGKSVPHTIGRNVIAMMSVARFDEPAHWYAVMQGGNPPFSISIEMLNPKYEALTVQIIANMKRDGVNMDLIYGVRWVGSTRETMPLLHAAVADDRVSIVETLLEGSCTDGMAAHVLEVRGETLRQTVERDILEVAKEGSASENLIRVWRAKNSVSNVLEKAGTRRTQS